MQTSLLLPEDDAVKAANRKLLDAVREAVARISIKELAFRLNVQPSLLADALAERANKGVRASWLIAVIDMAPLSDALAILNVLGERRRIESRQRRDLTPEEKAERYEEKLRSLGATGLRLIQEALGEEP